MRGKFIVLEGIDGCGKDTQIDLLKNFVLENNLQEKFYFTRLPGGTNEWTQKIRSLIFNEEYRFSDKAEAFLIYADRAEVMEKEILKNLNEGKNVICNRFELSQYAYQIYGKEREDLRWLTDWLMNAVVGESQPDLYIYYDISVTESEKRRINREKEIGGGNYFDQKKKDFFERTVLGYKIEIQKYKHVVINGEESREVVFQNTLQEIKKLCGI